MSSSARPNQDGEGQQSPAEPTLAGPGSTHSQRTAGIGERGAAKTNPKMVRFGSDTLAAETRGNRPGFSTAAAPEAGERLYEHFKAQVREHAVEVSSGSFGAEMKVALVNDGPVTIWLDTDQR
jgi:D-tyrosyl-tRNA(Tyr) deacylase